MKKIFFFGLILLLGSCQSYSRKQEQQDKFQILSIKGSGLTPPQRQFILRQKYSSRSALEAQVDQLMGSNQQQSENTDPKEPARVGPTAEVSPFRPGRNFLDSSGKK